MRNFSEELHAHLDDFPMKHQEKFPKELTEKILKDIEEFLEFLNESSRKYLIVALEKKFPMKRSG